MSAFAPLTVLASIPSPSFHTLELGPLTLRMYGLCIAAGVLAAVWISARRWEARGGHADDISAIALWTVPAGVIGARLYHVATDWRSYQGRWGDAFKITQGGLGIPGGVALGVIVGVIVVKRRGLPVRPLMDVVAPAIPVAQAIGRLGNWFNQELFGRATSLPWALEVDAEKALEVGELPGTTFHPTFLYEALWNLALAGTLVLLDRTKKLRPAELFALYVLGYALGRFWVEQLRIDQASLIGGVRVNTWMSLVLALGAAAFIAWNRRPSAATEVAPEAPDGSVVDASSDEAVGGERGDDDAVIDGDTIDDDAAAVADGDEPSPGG